MRLAIRDLGVRFGDRLLFSELSFDVSSGEFVTVMGPSGAGKSTLLGVINGNIPPSEGTVTFDWQGAREYLIDWVFQTSPMLHRRSALENAALGAIVRGMQVASALDHASEALAVMGLNDRARDPLHALSGGERQRVAVARAIASGAPLLMADEPTASLDASSRRAVVESLSLAASRGSAVVVATHDEYVGRASDRTIYIRPPDSSE